MDASRVLGFHRVSAEDEVVREQDPPGTQHARDALSRLRGPNSIFQWASWVELPPLPCPGASKDGHRIAGAEGVGRCAVPTFAHVARPLCREKQRL